ncbi:MAG: dihydrolipoyl dehydrogenase family protein, partial [Vulcanimicrobiota bacterium]
MKYDYDIIVIGSGVAGSTVARRCAGAGWKTAVVDNRPLGGTCSQRGCDPKKVLYEAADIVRRSQMLEHHGISRTAGIDWKDLMRFKNSFTRSIPEDTRENFEDKGIDIYRGTASFTGNNSIWINTEEISSSKFVIATGSSPRKLGIPGEENLAYSDDFLKMEDMPNQIVFLGGGYISFEFAFIAKMAGCENVTILEEAPQPLGNFDSYLVEKLLKICNEIGINVVVNFKINTIKKECKFYKIDGEFDSTDKRIFKTLMVVHGAGRTPNIDKLNLEKANVDYNKKGIIVNQKMQSVSNKSIYAAGDVTARGKKLTPVAALQGSTIADNLLDGDKSRASMNNVPFVLFTIPPLASVGITEDEIDDKSEVTIIQQDTSDWFSSRRIGLNHSGYKIITDREGHVILGAHILGHNSQEVINLVALAMKHGLRIDQLENTIFT